jgi:hypothetical protein
VNGPVTRHATTKTPEKCWLHQAAHEKRTLDGEWLACQQPVEAAVSTCKVPAILAGFWLTYWTQDYPPPGDAIFGAEWVVRGTHANARDPAVRKRFNGVSVHMLVRVYHSVHHSVHLKPRFGP